MHVVRRVLARLLSDAMLATNSAKMSDYIKANFFNVEARVDRKRPWVCLTDRPVPAVELERIWLPQTALQLSGNAGALILKHLTQARHASNTERLRRAGPVGGTQAEPEAADDPATMAQGGAP